MLERLGAQFLDIAEPVVELQRDALGVGDRDDLLDDGAHQPLARLALADRPDGGVDRGGQGRERGVDAQLAPDAIVDVAGESGRQARMGHQLGQLGERRVTRRHPPAR